MKTGIFVLAALSAVASAQMSACAQNCLLDNLKTTACDLSDYECLCKDSSFFSTIATCIKGSCTPSEVQAAGERADAICKQYGIELPSSGSDDVGEGAASTGGAAPGTTGCASGTAYETSQVTEATATAATSVEAQPSSAGGSSPSNGTGASKSAPPVATFTGAASSIKNKGTFALGLGALVAAAL